MARNYRAALALDPTNLRARLGLADKLRELRDVDEAEAESEPDLDLPPLPPRPEAA